MADLTIDKMQVAIEGDSTGLQNALKKGTQSVETFESSLGKMVKGLLTAETAAKAFEQLWRGIQFNMAAEQAQASFEVMIGSAEGAKQSLKELKDYANTTPLEFKDLRDATQTMLGFGIPIKEAQTYLKQLGDVSGGDAEKLKSLSLVFSQVSSQGKLMGQDMLQMIGVGFNPLKIISQQTGKSMADLKVQMEKGKISFDMVKDAFASATSKGGLYFGMLDKQSKTLAGKMSTMNDAVETALGALTEAFKPVISGFVDVVTAITTGFAALPEPMRAFVGAAAAVGAAVLGLSGALTAMGIALPAAFGPISAIVMGLGAFTLALMSAGSEAEKQRFENTKKAVDEIAQKLGYSTEKVEEFNQRMSEAGTAMQSTMGNAVNLAEEVRAVSYMAKYDDTIDKMKEMEDIIKRYAKEWGMTDEEAAAYISTLKGIPQDLQTVADSMVRVGKIKAMSDNFALTKESVEKLIDKVPLAEEKFKDLGSSLNEADFNKIASDLGLTTTQLALIADTSDNVSGYGKEIAMSYREAKESIEEATEEIQIQRMVLDKTFMSNIQEPAERVIYAKKQIEYNKRKTEIKKAEDDVKASIDRINREIEKGTMPKEEGLKRKIEGREKFLEAYYDRVANFGHEVTKSEQEFAENQIKYLKENEEELSNLSKKGERRKKEEAITVAQATAALKQLNEVELKRTDIQYSDLTRTALITNAEKELYEAQKRRIEVLEKRAKLPGGALEAGAAKELDSLQMAVKAYEDAEKSKTESKKRWTDKMVAFDKRMEEGRQRSKQAVLAAQIKAEEAEAERLKKIEEKKRAIREKFIKEYPIQAQKAYDEAIKNAEEYFDKLNKTTEDSFKEVSGGLADIIGGATGNMINQLVDVGFNITKIIANPMDIVSWVNAVKGAFEILKDVFKDTNHEMKLIQKQIQIGTLTSTEGLDASISEIEKKIKETGESLAEQAIARENFLSFGYDAYYEEGLKKELKAQQAQLETLRIQREMINEANRQNEVLTKYKNSMDNLNESSRESIETAIENAGAYREMLVSAGATSDTIAVLDGEISSLNTSLKKLDVSDAWSALNTHTHRYGQTQKDIVQQHIDLTKSIADAEYALNGNSYAFQMLTNKVNQYGKELELLEKKEAKASALIALNTHVHKYNQTQKEIVQQHKELTQAVADTEYALNGNSSAYKNLINEVSVYGIELKRLEEIESLGQGISSKLSQGLIDGLDKDGFLQTIKSMFRDMAAQAIIMASGVQAKIQEIAQQIVAGGFSQASMQAAKDSLSALWSTAQSQMGQVTSVLDTVFGMPKETASSGGGSGSYSYDSESSETSSFSQLPKYALGTNYAPGGVALVGERGPELVHLPRGSKVTPNSQLRGGKSGSTQITVNNYSPNALDPAQSAMLTRQSMRQLSFEGAFV